MRRIDIVRSINKINRAINDSNIHEITLSGQAEKKVSLETIFDGYKIWSFHNRNFNDNDKNILKIFNFDRFEKVDFWTSILTNRDKEGLKHVQGLKYFKTYLQEIIALLKQDNLEFELNGEPEKSTAAIGKDILTIILPEDNTKLSSPQRLIKALDAINELYGAIAEIQNRKNDLSVAAIDSGSDKSFDFLGAAEAIKALKELLLGVWDKIAFHKEKKAVEIIELISKSLPVIDTLSQMQKDEKIDSHSAEKLKRNILSGLNNFVSSGTMLPEFNHYSQPDPKVILAPEPRLLNHGEDVAEKTIPTNENDDLSEEDLKEAINLLKEQRKGNNNPHP